EFVEKKQFEKVKLVLGPALDLQALYPERHEFHISEFMTFYKTVVNYYCQTGDIENATKTLELMLEIDPAHDACAHAENLILYACQEKEAEDLRRERDHFKALLAESYDVPMQTTEKPTFHFQEIWELYRYGLDLDISILQQILLLPPDQLVQDLEKMLLDSIQRYEYFADQEHAGEIAAEQLEFPLHALFLLAELEAGQSLPLILDFLRQGMEFLDFWLGDMMTEFLWEIIYKVGQRDLALLQAFMCERNRYAYAVSSIGAALVQIALHQPERKEEIVSLYRSLFDHYLDHADDKNLIDSFKIASYISDAVDLHAVQLLPQIEKCYDHDIVDIFVCGTLAKVKKEIQPGAKELEKDHIPDIFARYESFAENWSQIKDSDDYEDDSQLSEAEEEDILDQSPLRSEKTGRNEPCPCGSGLKYKKCCWGKE
ncbi:DUF1186 domain-containing protein, partial [candidate division KSB1 bacterium]|nr:DUF1186 domain-containing protein [candidate division KSB1 bacterium]